MGPMSSLWQLWHIPLNRFPNGSLVNWAPSWHLIFSHIHVKIFRTFQIAWYQSRQAFNKALVDVSLLLADRLVVPTFLLVAWKLDMTYVPWWLVSSGDSCQMAKFSEQWTTVADWMFQCFHSNFLVAGWLPMKEGWFQPLRMQLVLCEAWVSGSWTSL